MNFIKYLNRIERIDQLIRLRATGNPKELAYKLDISESLLYDTLAGMKILGAPIAYNKFSETYYYTETGKINFTFSKLSLRQEKEIIGGKNSKILFTPKIPEWGKLYLSCNN